MLDKAKLGSRYTCFQCGTKFYDLNRPVASCPECGADQADAPTRDMRSILTSKGGPKPKAEPKPKLDPDADEGLDGTETEDVGLFDSADGEDDGLTLEE